MSSATELVARRELLWNLTLRELRSRYKRSVLGWGWSLLNPLAFMLLYTFAFSIVLRAKPEPGDPSGLENFPLFLMAGFLPWTFFLVSTTSAMSSILENSSLVRKVSFPQEHLVISTMIAGLFTLGIEFGVLAIAFAIFGNIVILQIPMVIVAAVLVGIFATGVGLVLAAGNVFFRDLGYLWGIVGQAWFFLTPIVYPPSLVDERLGNHEWLLKIYHHQPIAVIARIFRNLLYDMRWPEWSDLLLFSGYAFAALALGWWLFSKYEPRFAEEL